MQQVQAEALQQPSQQHNNRAVAHLPPDSRLQLGLHPGCHELLRSYSTLSQVFYSNVHFGLKEGVAFWTKQLLEALHFIIPEGVDGVSWKNHMSSFLAVDSRLCCTQHARHFARASHNSLLHPLCLCVPTANAASMHSG